MKFWLLVTLLMVGFFGCKTTDSGDGGSSLASASDGIPPSGSGNKLDVQRVVKAMRKIQAHEAGKINQSTIEACTANNTPHWSYIVSHFYCQIGQGRACFTGYVRNQSNPGAGTTKIYRDGYRKCSSDPDFGYIDSDSDISNAFQYVMFTVYSPGGIDTFTTESQDDAINEFYGVTSNSNCSQRFTSSTDARRSANERCGTFSQGGGGNNNNGGSQGTGDVVKAKKHLAETLLLVNDMSENCTWYLPKDFVFSSKDEYEYSIEYVNDVTGKSERFTDFFAKITNSPKKEANLYIDQYPTDLATTKCVKKGTSVATGGLVKARSHVKDTLKALNKKVKNCTWFLNSITKTLPNGEYDYKATVYRWATDDTFDYKDFFGSVNNTVAKEVKGFFDEWNDYKDSGCQKL